MRKKTSKYFLLIFIFLGLSAAGAWYWFYGCGLEANLTKRFECYLKRGQTEKAVALVLENKFQFHNIFHGLTKEGLEYRYRQRLDSAEAAMETAWEIAQIYQEKFSDGFLEREWEFCNGLEGERLRKKIELDSLYLLGYQYSRQSNDTTALKRARNHFEASLQICQEIRDLKREVDNHLQIQTLFFQQDLNQEALQIGEKALVLCKRIAYRQKEGWILYNNGRSHLFLTEYPLAIENFDSALVLVKKLEDKHLEANLLSRKGISLLRMGNFEEALIALNNAITVSEESNNVIVETQSYLDRGKIYRRLGYFTLAKDDIQKAISLENLPEDDKAVAYNNLGELYRTLGDYEKAFNNLLKALELYRKMGRNYESAATLKMIGDVYFGQGNKEIVLQQYREAQQLIQDMEAQGATGFNDLKAEITLSIGDVYKKSKEWERALEIYRDALRAFKDIDSKEYIALTLIRIGEIYRNQKDFHSALMNLTEAQQIADKLQYPFLLSDIYYTMGLAAWEQGQFREAETTLLQAIHTVEQTRGKIIGEEKIYFFALATIQDIYDAMILFQFDRGNDEAAFNFSERSRARAFLDILQDKYEVTDQNLKIQFRPFTLPEIQHSLNAEVQFLEYKITQDRLLIFFGDQSRLKIVDIPISREELLELVFEFRRIIGADEYNTFKKNLLKDSEKLYTGTMELAWQLYKLLIKPMENDLRPNKTLYIIPDEALFYLPFTALTTIEEGDEKFLIQDYPLVFAPSASILKFSLDSRKPEIEPDKLHLFALANPLGDLPYSEKEVRTIAHMYSEVDTLIGFRVKEPEVMNLLNRDFHVLHFATHAFIDERNPLYSHLVLGTESYLNSDTSASRFSVKMNPNDDLLMAFEVLSLDLSGARLANLSACKTFGGRLFRGEGIVGLTRAFITAGALSVITTLWDIDDRYTEKLMGEFYYQWIKNKTTKAQALRAAQLKVIKEMAKDPQFGFPHPHRWAAFTLTGDYK
ncbi:MAG: hypothetical protein CV087_09620 [Candidatus Brocadia sp. WS118]|nr:MAG: hypothetical protein CV087_09620 [Candidatus Brocadia sp. WS118]